MAKGKLQVFGDNEFLYSATLRRCASAYHQYFELRIFDDCGKLIFLDNFASASAAKERLENYDNRCRWYTERGYVCDVGEN